VLAQNRGSFGVFFLVFWVLQIVVHTTRLFGTFSKVLNSGQGVQQYGFLAHFPRQNIWGAVFGVVSGFLLAGNVLLLLIYLS
jgi:hypothetical protein